MVLNTNICNCKNLLGVCTFPDLRHHAAADVITNKILPSTYAGPAGVAKSAGLYWDSAI